MTKVPMSRVSSSCSGHIVGVLDGVCACINHNLNSLD
jgi:hypothetical protein